MLDSSQGRMRSHNGEQRCWMVRKGVSATRWWTIRKRRCSRTVMDSNVGRFAKEMEDAVARWLTATVDGSQKRIVTGKALTVWENIYLCLQAKYWVEVIEELTINVRDRERWLRAWYGEWTIIDLGFYESSPYLYLIFFNYYKFII